MVSSVTLFTIVVFLSIAVIIEWVINPFIGGLLLIPEILAGLLFMVKVRRVLKNWVIKNGLENYRK